MQENSALWPRRGLHQLWFSILAEVAGGISIEDLVHCRQMSSVEKYVQQWGIGDPDRKLRMRKLEKKATENKTETPRENMRALIACESKILFLKIEWMEIQSALHLYWGWQCYPPNNSPTGSVITESQLFNCIHTCDLIYSASELKPSYTQLLIHQK